MHLVVNVAVLEFVCEGAKILGEHAHGRGVEQVLEAPAQTQFERIANAKRIDRAYVNIRRSEIYIGGKMIDSVDPLTQRIELFCGKTELSLTDVSDHDAYARSKPLIPDVGLLQSGADTLEAMFGVIGPDNAVNHQIGVLLQEVQQKETTDETGRSGQKYLFEITRRDSGGRCFSADCLVNESAKGIDVSLAMRWQRSNKRGHRRVGNGFFDHVSFPKNRAYSLHRRQVFCLCIHGEAEVLQSLLNSIFIIAKIIGY